MRCREAGPGGPYGGERTRRMRAGSVSHCSSATLLATNAKAELKILGITTQTHDASRMVFPLWSWRLRTRRGYPSGSERLNREKHTQEVQAAFSANASAHQEDRCCHHTLGIRGRCEGCLRRVPRAARGSRCVGCESSRWVARRSAPGPFPREPNVVLYLAPLH